MDATTDANIELVQRSFDIVSLKADEFTEAFYRNLFGDYPAAQPLFEHVDLVRQRKKLFAMLTLVVSHLKRMDILFPVMEELGQRHIRYGVTSDLYGAFVSSFLKSVGEVAPEHWDRDVADAWQAALDQICDQMIAGAERAAATNRRTAQSDDLKLLMEISGQPMISSAHTRLFSSFLAKKAQDYDLQIARDVQRTLLPSTLPQIEDYEIHAVYDPARTVGGDYYDCFALDESRICVSFGDVSGKGVPAAIIMARLASAVQSTMRFTNDVREAISAINSHMCHRAAEGRFVTFVLLVLDLTTHSVRLTNAGHRPPLVLRPDGNLEDLGLPAVGPPLGVMDGQTYEAVSRDVGPGETIMLFTDGVDEAMSPASEHYGMDRVRAFLDRSTPRPGDLGLALLNDIRNHAAGRPPSDDVSILTISRRESSE
ncbi:MAG: PP2C family protein-serine/threonine phosphatase [Planctomycetota bacterium]|jgi:serine phosphatase RsbU (regulator of sigma subunit)